MTPILGIIASSQFVSKGSFESIATVNGNGSSTTLSLSSIPATYASLQIRGIVRNNRNNPSFPFGNLSIDFNGVSGSNARHSLNGDGASVTATGDTGITSCTIGETATDAQTASVMTAFVIDILDYTSTTKNKTIRSFIGTDVNGTGRIALSSSLYLETPSAIASITFKNFNSAAFTTSTSFALYGIKG
jgi:hypothetical protein